jgi:hypothetical protein
LGNRIVFGFDIFVDNFWGNGHQLQISGTYNSYRRIAAFGSVGNVIY